MRVAFYYHQQKRLPANHEGNNPYGALLAEALERRGVEMVFETNCSPEYLRRNQGRIQVLHLHWPHHDYYNDDERIMQRQMEELAASLELARELGYKVVWTSHNIYPHNRTHQHIDHEFRLHLCRLCTAIIAHCAASAAGVKETFGRSHDIFLAPHGHFIGVYPDIASQSEARRDLGIPAGDFAYGFIGGVLPYKGLETLIETFRRLPGEDSWLLLAGGGRYRPYLNKIRKLAAGHPRILDRIVEPRAPTPDLMRVLRASNAIVLPFLATMSSGTVTLALSESRPVIAPNLGCLPEVILSGGGLLYDPNRPGALLEAMREIQGWDLEEACRTALASIQRYDWDRIAEITLEAYRR